MALQTLPTVELETIKLNSNDARGISTLVRHFEQQLPDLAHNLDDIGAHVNGLVDHTSFDFSRLFDQLNVLIKDVKETVHKVVDTVEHGQAEESTNVNRSEQDQTGATENQSGSTPSQGTNSTSSSVVNQAGADQQTNDQGTFGPTTSLADLDLSDLVDHASFDFSRLLNQVNAFVEDLNATVHEVVDQHQAEVGTLVRQLEEQLPDVARDLGSLGASVRDLVHQYDLQS
jgi:hypothetical protein